VPASPSAIRRPRRRHRRHLHLATVVVASTLLPLALGGCYRRVVGVKNDPGYEGKVYEPNLKEGEQNAMVELFTIERTRPVSD